MTNPPLRAIRSISRTMAEPTPLREACGNT
jgi:hypothetical protein